MVFTHLSPRFYLLFWKRKLELYPRESILLVFADRRAVTSHVKDATVEV